MAVNKRAVSCVLLALIGIPLAVSIGVALAIAVIALTAEPARAAGQQCGRASWYGRESGNTTANGEGFRPGGYSFAMRAKPSRPGIRYRVTFRGRTIVAPHNDYGPARWTGRRFDLSEGLAAALGLKRHGVGFVCIDRVHIARR